MGLDILIENVFVLREGKLLFTQFLRRKEKKEKQLSEDEEQLIDANIRFHFWHGTSQLFFLLNSNVKKITSVSAVSAVSSELFKSNLNVFI